MLATRIRCDMAAHLLISRFTRWEPFQIKHVEMKHEYTYFTLDKHCTRRKTLLAFILTAARSMRLHFNVLNCSSAADSTRENAPTQALILIALQFSRIPRAKEQMFADMVLT